MSGTYLRTLAAGIAAVATLLPVAASAPAARPDLVVPELHQRDRMPIGDEGTRHTDRVDLGTTPARGVRENAYAHDEKRR